MNFLPFNPLNTFYKSVVGAVKNGQQLRFRISMPRSFQINAAFFVIQKENGNEKLMPMYWAGMDGADKEIWDIETAFSETGLYFYHFIYETPFGRGFISDCGNRTGGVWSADKEFLKFPLTVFDMHFKTPDKLKGGIIYQIFPDRFYNSKKLKRNIPKDRFIHNNIDDLPFYKPNKDGKVLNNDYFGGDLNGIIEKLPYLKSLGVTFIYLNPIFESHSNHRYDTADYEKIDSLLGTEEDFKKLCEKANKNGIKIILDGVFSHTGADSKYFNKYNRYTNEGAYNSKKSPYYKWFDFRSFPDDYRSWWGFENLPEVNEDEQSFIEYITGKNGILRKWIRLGAAGFRLDVADELPDSFIKAVNAAVKAENPNAVIIGEVWENAALKTAYGKRRTYLLGDELDSVMNYPFSNAILNFARFGNAVEFSDEIRKILDSYPKCVSDVLMNHLGTHDTERAITAISGDDVSNHDRAWQEAHHKLTSEQYEKGKKLFKMASILQYTLPGVPSLYYGNEAGMTGYKDPFNRCFYPWGKEDSELIDFFKTLGTLRKNETAFKDGDFVGVSAMLSCVCYERIGKTHAFLTIANRNEEDIDYNLPEHYHFSSNAFTKQLAEYSVKVPKMSAIVLKRKLR